MKQFEIYKFCPRCSKDLKVVNSYILKCSTCGLNFFQSFKPACNAVIINEKNEVLLGKRASDPHKGKYNLPGGFIGLDETAEEALEREIKEELNLEMKVYSKDYIGSFYLGYDYQNINYDVLILFFVVKVQSSIINQITPQDDVESVEFVQPNKAFEMLVWDADSKAIKKYFNL